MQFVVFITLVGFAQTRLDLPLSSMITATTHSLPVALRQRYGAYGVILNSTHPNHPQADG
jgi:hypothetical protein